ncbi:phosphoenolpyruvate carboxykinase [Striga asiatica]|uniref:Phosphoenolpyruvate carboxykinase n=1 Tax=Striga asiatica TaxID=4170 RepID=A0A5A7Q461_STRAF|nr:phosphoenolpyruvate carboxykinase [Striga asiatica]
MIALHDILVVLENDLYEGSIVDAHYGRVEVYSAAVGRVRNAPDSKNSTYVEIIGEFQRGVCLDKRHAVQRRPRCTSVGVCIAEVACGGEDRSSETSGHDNVIFLRWLVGCDKNRHALAYVNVEGRVANLHRVGPLDLHHLHLVALDSDVERVLEPNVAYPQTVRFAYNL